MSDYAVFADESGVGEQYLVFGAVFVPAEHVDAVEAELEVFCKARGAADREMSWKKCSRREVERYCDFVELFPRLAQRFGVEFRAMVVDVHKHPLKHEVSGSATAEQGFYKFYHFFITRSIEIVTPAARKVFLHVADLTDQYAHRSEILTKTVSGQLRGMLPNSFEVAEVVRASPSGHRTHELADVLVGAVSYRLNGRVSQKEQICAAVERNVGKRLDQDFFPSDRPFNVWSFAPSGQKRWARGARGHA